MTKKTPFYECHLAANGKMVDFAGWLMPLHYGSQLEEHQKVRQGIGFFDVSHMGVVDIKGVDAFKFLSHLLANDVGRLIDGKALYTCMLNEQGGIIDDLIVYKVNDHYFRLVINAGTRDKDITWMKRIINNYDAQLIERNDLVMIALQGPKVDEYLSKCVGKELSEQALQLKPFHFINQGEWFVARTGYTGEKGFEIICHESDALNLWQALQQAGVAPIGLGARDTLRLEAGLNLYGQDMDETTTPFESNLTWTLQLDNHERDFIGKRALLQKKQNGVAQELVGVILLQSGGIIRHDQTVWLPDGSKGVITSGGYSPTLNCSIGFARIPKTDAKTCEIEIRNKKLPAAIVKLPFVRHGKKVFE